MSDNEQPQPTHHVALELNWRCRLFGHRWPTGQRGMAQIFDAVRGLQERNPVMKVATVKCRRCETHLSVLGWQSSRFGFYVKPLNGH